MMRRRLPAAALLLCGLLAFGGRPAVAEDDAPPPNPNEAVAATIEGPWYGHIDGLDRPDRYLEIMAVEPGPSGTFRASALFGWADGPISPTPAEISIEGQSVALVLHATTGARVFLRFDGDQAQGTYRPAERTPRPIRFERVKDRSDYDWLGGVWIAKRNGQTRVFDVKRVVGTADGKIMAIGQYGIAEEPGRIRQMVATVEGDPATARVYWRTTNTTAELKRMTAAPALAGSFEVRDRGGKPEAIIFMQNGNGPPAAARRTIDLGKPFPNVVLVTLDGDKVRISDFRGKTVLVTFFQSWDVWSTDEMKAFRAAQKRFGDQLEILAVNYRALSDDVSPLSNTVNKVSPTIDVSDVDKMLEIKRIPAIWIVDRNGITADREGYMPEHSLLALLDKLVK